jgi:mono/diheme cytochrome c family protein
MQLYKQHLTCSLIAAAVLSLAACGGGGGTNTASVATTPVTTTVMDGLIENAVVCVDTNHNGICEPTETQGRTNASGQVTLAIPTAELATAALVAMIGTDAIDADTGPILTAYTLQTPAGKHSVISPLTHMVQTKINTEKVNGTVISVEAAETYVKEQTSLTVSVFDNFIAKRDIDSESKKAGEVARLLVVSTQESKKAAVITSTCTPSTSHDERDDDHEDDEHDKESHIDDNLVTRLREIRTLSDDIQRTCSRGDSKDGFKACDSHYKEKARIVSTCVTPIPVPKTAQTITFTSPANQTMGSTRLVLTASSNSGLGVTFASSTPLVCTVSGTALTLVAPGSCSVSASQLGDTSYLAATPVSYIFTIAAASGVTAQTITFVPPANQTIGMSTPSLSGTASSGLPLTFTSGTASVCSVNNIALTLLTAGTCTVTANQPGNSSFAAAAPVSGSFSVAAPAVKATQTITFAQPANPTLGVPPPTLSASSSSGLAVTFSSSTPSVCTVSGTALSLVAAGACTVAANQPGNASYEAAAAVARTLTVAAAAAPVVSAANGKVVYNTVFNGTSCASCHSTIPALNVSKVLRGANSASTILNAINSNKGGMGVLRNAYTTQQLNDMAAYLATPGI